MNFINRHPKISFSLSLIVFNAIILSGFNPFYIGSVYSFIYILFLPGYLLKRMLFIKGSTIFESIAYTIGLSLSLLYFIGISANLLSIFQIDKPLSMLNSLILFNATTVILWILNSINKEPFFRQIIYQKISKIHIAYYIIPVLFPLFSIFGSQLLDTSGSNILIMILLSLIPGYILLLALSNRKLSQFHFEIPIYFIGLSLLLMFSLRSQYIIGWDIYQEFKVFMLTLSNQFWSMKNFQDPYNACLSITILPTLFEYFTKLNPHYIFKILYQVIYAFVPVIIYSYSKRIANHFLVFISIFFFMSTINFFLEMPALIRQEIAFLYFGLLLLVFFDTQLSVIKKRFLFLVFSISLVLTHYSTTYIIILLFSFSIFLLSIHKAFFNKLSPKYLRKYHIETVPVLIFILFAYFWLGMITKTSSNISYTVSNIFANFNDFTNQTFNTSILDQLSLPVRKQNEKALIKQTIADKKSEYDLYNYMYYSPETYRNYIPSITHTENLPINIPKMLNDLLLFLNVVITKLVKVLIVFGFFGVYYLYKNKYVSIEYAVLTAGFGVAIFMLTTIPSLSLFYPIGRLDQQALFLVSVPTIIMISHFLKFVSYTLRILLITLFFSLYFLFSTTFISQLIGGDDAQIYLNNAGTYYSEIYLHNSELASINWLYANKNTTSHIFADMGSKEKIDTFSGEKYNEILFPVIPVLIDTDAYVYSNYANTKRGIGIIDIKVDRMEYNFPNEFLNQEKNLIYSNGQTQIFK